MNYIPAEKLISEIERLRNECAKSIGDGFVDGNLPKTMTSGGAAWVCERLLSFITSLQQEQPEVDLDALVNEAFDKYSSVDGYGQLSVSFNRAELYSFIKKITRKEK